MVYGYLIVYITSKTINSHWQHYIKTIMLLHVSVDVTIEPGNIYILVLLRAKNDLIYSSLQ